MLYKSKKHLFALLLAIGALYAPFLPCTIMRTDTFAPFFTTCENFSEKSLVVFDVDRVLIEPRDAIMRVPNQRLLWELRSKYWSHLSQAEMAKLASLVSLSESSRIVDPLASSFITHLKARNIPVIGLTATGVTGFGHIASIPDWRIADLERFGISFSTSFESQPPFILSQLNGKGPSPVFKSGILFTGGYSKGDVLEAFLDTVHFYPDKVFFADDLMYNLISVEESLLDMGITEVFSYHFLGADKIPNTIDPQIAELQVKTLTETQVWLSDQEARSIINPLVE